MKNLATLACVTISFVSTLSGCGLMGRASIDYSAKPIDLTDEKNEVAKTLAALKKYQSPENEKSADPKTSNDGKLAFDSCLLLSSTEPDICRLNRNRALSILIAASDTACNAHLRSMYGNEAVSNLVLGSLATVFMAASAGASAMAVDAKTNYAIAGTIFSAERSLVNDVVYKSILVPVIHQKILATRQMKRANLDKVYLHSYEYYPVERAVSMVVDYHSSCSFMEGLQLALREGSADTQAVRLRALYADAKTQFDALTSSLKPADQSDKNPVYKTAKNRLEAYGEALKTAELESARVINDPSKEKDEEKAIQKEKDDKAAAEIEKMKAVTAAVLAERDKAAAEKLAIAIQAERDKAEAVRKAVADALVNKSP